LLLVFVQDAQEPSGIREGKSGSASFDSILLLSEHPLGRFHTTFLCGHPFAPLLATAAVC